VEVWQTSSLRRLRLGEEKKERRKKNKRQDENIMVIGLPYSIGQNTTVGSSSLFWRSQPSPFTLMNCPSYFRHISIAFPLLPHCLSLPLFFISIYPFFQSFHQSFHSHGPVFMKFKHLGSFVRSHWIPAYIAGCQMAFCVWAKKSNIFLAVIGRVRCIFIVHLQTAIW